MVANGGSHHHSSTANGERHYDANPGREGVGGFLPKVSHSHASNLQRVFCLHHYGFLTRRLQRVGNVEMWWKYSYSGIVVEFYSLHFRGLQHRHCLNVV